MTGTFVVAGLVRKAVRNLSRRISAFKWGAVFVAESDERMWVVKNVSAYLLVLSAILGIFVEGTSATMPELQLPAQPLPPLAIIPQTTKLPLRTPEQEAALIDVRKILREAREVAETIQTPAPLLSDRHRRKALERMKDELLNRIEEAQLQAGDVTITSTLTALSNIGFKKSLALAQAQYGFTNEAVQTAATETVTGESLMLLVEALVQSGDIPAAIRLAEMQLPRDGVTLWRQKTATAIFSYIAEEQYKAGDLHARETLNRAIKEKPSSKFAHTTEYIHALIYLGRAQAALGDKVASAETFKQAIDALSIKRKDRHPPELLRWIAKAQAEAGDAAASQQTFRRAIQEGPGYVDLACLAWAQDVTGNHEGAAESLELAIDGAGKLSSEEQAKARYYIAEWQMKIGARDAAAAIIDQLRQSGALVNARVLATRFGFFDRALAIDAEMRDSDVERASFLSHFVKRLVETGDPIGTNERLQQLSQEAAQLRNRLPKDPSKSEWMLAHIAFVHAAAGDLAEARKTLQQMADGGPLSVVYEWIVDMFVHKGDLTTATQIASEMHEERRPFTTMFQHLGRAFGKFQEVTAGLAWARQQQNAYARTNSLLGIAEGLIKVKGIQARAWSDSFLRTRCPS
jgi:tetratricopeptide (TPR) repeat protein